MGLPTEEISLTRKRDTRKRSPARPAAVAPAAPTPAVVSRHNATCWTFAPPGGRTTAVYDPADRPVASVNAFFGATTVYDAASQAVATSDPPGPAHQHGL